MPIYDLPIRTEIFGGVIFFLVAAFILAFLIPALWQIIKLRGIQRALIRADAKDLDALSKVFQRDKIMSHLWDEFSDTLHKQKDVNAQGVYEVTAIRQTLPAETYFNEQILIYSPTRAELFKHLPGVLTGISIIGTFSGLILGLQAFNVSDKPDVVRNSLNGLLQGVGQAFVISAAAITMAMLITAAEKLLLSILGKQVETLCLFLDSKFDAGAGEEYLERLVHSSESSAKEAKQLKQSLVTDLKEILESLANRQIEAQTSSTASIAKNIVDGITGSLQKPLTEISAAVQHVSGSQGDAVNKLLTDTMAAMTAQIRDLFSGQVDGIRGMQQQTIDSLNTAVSRLEQLTSDISSKGAEATNSMNERLASALASMEERQRAMNEQTQALVDSMRSHASQSQAETTESIQNAIAKMTSSVAELVAALQSNINSASIRDEQRSKALADHTTHATGELAEVTKSLMQRSDEAIAAMRQVVEALRAGTSETVNRMNMGAADMLRAATEMARVGSTTGTALERAQGLVDQLAGASGALTSSTATLSRALEDYRTTRDSMVAMATQLTSIVESAKKEASLTADVLARINEATNKLKEAQLQADKYLSGVSDVLTSAHEQFGKQIIGTLNSVNGEFHKHVERGTKALAGAIDELEQVVDRAGGR